MLRLTGQAALMCGKLAHRLVTVAIALCLLAAACCAALAWRLSQGPLPLPWITHWIERQASADFAPTEIRIESAALAWEGFSSGVDRPLDIRLTGIIATDHAGVRIMEVPRTDVSLSLASLLIGHLRPRAIEIDQPSLQLTRSAEGRVRLDLESDTAPSDAGEQSTELPSVFEDLLQELGRPSQTDHTGLRSSHLSQLRKIRITGASIGVVDHAMGVTWRAARGDLSFVRLPAGGVDGMADLTLMMGGQTAKLTLSASQTQGGAGTHVSLSTSPILPAALATELPRLAALSALDAQVAANAELDLGPLMEVREALVAARVGPGTAHFNGSAIPLAGASVRLSGTSREARLDAVRLELVGHEGAAPTVIDGMGTMKRADGKLSFTVKAGIDQVAFADLPALWPRGTGGGARPWVTKNITAGTARNAHVEVAFEAPEDFSDATLTAASGIIDAQGLTVSWLPPIPPVTGANARMKIVDPDTLDIAIQGGRQMQDRGKGQMVPMSLNLRSGHARIVGLAHRDQVGTFEADLVGSFADTVSLLKHPRLKLFEKRPLDLRDPVGDVTAKLTIKLPLEDKVSVDRISIHAAGRVANAHLTGIAAGRDLDRAGIDFDVTADGLKLSGKGDLAQIPAQIAAELDFRSGPPSQVLQHITASGKATVGQMAAAGLDGGPLIAGTAGVDAAYTIHRDGKGDVKANVDLTSAELIAEPLRWRKPPGVHASGRVSVRLDQNRMLDVDLIQIDGDGITLHGQSDLADGRPSLVRLDSVTLGRSRGSGTVRFPPHSGQGPIEAKINGALVDLAPRLTRSGARVERFADQTPGPAWVVDARFDQGLMAKGAVVSALSMSAASDGRVMQRLRLSGETAGRAPFVLEVKPSPGGRTLTATAADAGGLLRALDVIGSMEGGRLAVNARYDDSRLDRPLSGEAEITDFRMRDAPAIGRVLKAMTLYGLVDALSGAGLSFTRLTAPFWLTDDAIGLNDARAYSSSLGLTAKGRIDLVRNTADVEGTVVPAYFFNSLLGKIPLVGKIFSPEQGGGLFAATYVVKGPLNDPSVSVNPLAALTPGFLRGMFGDLDPSKTARP